MARTVLLSAFFLTGCNCQTPVNPTEVPLDGGFWDKTGLSGKHLPTCDDPACGDGSVLPLGGDHCAAPIACRKYTTEQQRCGWIHNLEHGHAVLLYNCPGGCPDEVAKLESHFDAQLPHRTLVAPDGRLPKRFAALVWSHGWLGDDYDGAAVQTILDQQDQDAPEKGLACPN